VFTNFSLGLFLIRHGRTFFVGRSSSLNLRRGHAIETFPVRLTKRIRDWFDLPTEMLSHAHGKVIRNQKTDLRT
jgi:hypothetical protein